MANRRLLLLVNPNASRAAVAMGPAFAVLANSGFDLDIRQPADCDAMSNEVRKAADDVAAIVVAGGDGTVNGALAALIEAGKPVGVLPFGTANDLALTLGIPADPAAAAEVIAEGATRRIDVGRVNGRPFLNVASIGLSVQVAKRQDAQRKQQWRVLSYILTTIEVLGDADRFHAVIDCDGEKTEVDAYQIAVGNGVHYGGGMTVSPEAAIDDGVLDVYAIETRSIAELVRLAPALRAGTHGRHPNVTVFRTPKLRIETSKPMPVNTDGEVNTETPAEFVVERKALEIYAPPAAQD